MILMAGFRILKSDASLSLSSRLDNLAIPTLLLFFPNLGAVAIFARTSKRVFRCIKELPDARAVAKAKAVESEGSIRYNKHGLSARRL